MTATAARRRRRAGTPRAGVPLPLLVPAGLAVAFLAIPLLGLLGRTPWGSIGAELASPRVAEALRLSLVCSLGAVAVSIVLGVPLAFLLARVEFPGRNLVRALTTLPMVFPPVVGGVALLLAFGRRGLLGRSLDMWGLSVSFTTAAVVMAQLFIASPFFVKSARAGFEAVDVRFEAAARTLGAGPWRVFWTVTVPLARPALLSGLVLAWARALSEFGATMMFAGNFPGRTQRSEEHNV